MLVYNIPIKGISNNLFALANFSRWESYHRLMLDKSKKLKSTHETRNIDSDSKKVRY